ncbi:MAG: hypothetical protein ACJ71Z_08650 [Aeromicrobium sp.]
MTDDVYNLSDDQDRDDRRKHLELVSLIIARQAGASATAKGWSITIASAAFGVAVIRESWYLLALGVAVLLAFSILDSLYLHNEQKFRDLYDAIARNDIAPFAMDLVAAKSARTKNKSYFSWSIACFYGPLLAAALILTTLALADHDDGNGERDQGRHSHLGATPHQSP